MAFCANCGAQVEGRFCAKCGAPVAAGAPPAGSPPPSPTYQAPPPPVVPGPVYQSVPQGAAAPMADNLASTLCYVLGFITGIIFLVLAPYNQNKTVRFHAFQSIFLSVAAICIRVVLAYLLIAIHFWSFLWLSSLVGLAFLALWIYMLVATYQGKQVVLPIIGPLAQQQA